MERKELIRVEGLRSADPGSLSVLTQDVLRLPIAQIELVTLADLLALSELEGLPGELSRGLAAFREQAFRELQDIPDGAMLKEWCDELAKVDAGCVPGCLREAVVQLGSEREHPDSAEGIQGLLGLWEATVPKAVELPSAETSEVVPEAEVIKPTKKPAKKPRKRAGQVDEERSDWIEEDVLGRLIHYPQRGLKEPILVAGSRHRAPWEDLKGADVLSVLRRLKREGKVRHSAGRWILDS